MGIVYSVEHTQTGEHLALKVMNAHHGATRDAIERFKREARASAKIKSEHVVRIIDADVAPELDRAPYLVMDLLDGADLERASGEQPVAAPVVLDWLRQIARALDKAHRIGITHRDLKPENLFLTYREDGSPLIKILDFGIAKISAESTGTTQSGQILGTPLYMSPEQARGDASKIGPAADLYALGLIAYKLLVGSPYWNATSVAGIIGQVLYEPMPLPSARGSLLGPEFDQWFLRACSRDPAERFGSATEQVEALAQVLGLPVDTRNELTRSNPGDSGPRGSLGEPSGVGLGSTDRRPPIGLGSNPEATAVAQSGTLVSSSKEMPDVRVLTMSRRRNALMYGVLAVAVVLSILVVILYRSEPVAQPSVVLARPAAAQLEVPKPSPVVAATAVVEPRAPVTAPAELSGPKNDTVAAIGPASVTKPPKWVIKPSLPSKATSSAVPARPEKTFVNDPLGDQK